MPPAQNSQFDFILSDPQKPPKRFGLPSGLPMPVLVLVVLVVILLLALVFGSLLGKNGPSNASEILDLMAQDQEILRVTNANQTNFKDPNNLALSATATAALTSQQTDFTSYLSKVGVKYKASALNSRQNSQTDTTLQTAVANNNFDQAYDTYLNQALTFYQSSIVTTSKTSSKNFDALLNSAYQSNKALLGSPQLVSAPSS